MSSSEKTNSFEVGGERIASSFKACLENISLDIDGMNFVQLDITCKHKAFPSFQRTYILQKNADGTMEFHSTETACPVPVDPSGPPSNAPESVWVSDEELQAFDAIISDPDINRQFILSLKRARSAGEVAEAVLRLVKNGVIDEDEACKKCFANRILPFCNFPKGKSETNISNTIRNLLTQKHHDIKLSLQRLNQQTDSSSAHEGNCHL